MFINDDMLPCGAGTQDRSSGDTLKVGKSRLLTFLNCLERMSSHNYIILYQVENSITESTLSQLLKPKTAVIEYL